MIGALTTSALAMIAVFVLARVYRSVAAGAGLAVFAYVLDAVLVDPTHFEFAGFNVFLVDVVGVALLAVAAARMLMFTPIRRQLRGAVPLTAAMGVAFVLGAAWYGVKPAGVEYREWFSLCAAVLYCASFPLDSRQMRELVRVWLMGACALTALAAFRWMAGALQLGIAAHWAVNNATNYWRVLNAGQAFYLGESLLILLYLRRHAVLSIWLSALAWILAATVLVLQHRSVYVAVLAGCAVMAWRERAFPNWPRTVAAAAVLLALVYAIQPEWIAGKNQLKEDLLRSVEEPFDTGNSTFAWRVSMWQAYLLEYAALPPAQKMVGTGLGNPAIYSIESGDLQVAAHSLYVFLLNRAGVLGLAAFLACYAVVLRRIRGTAGCWDYLGMLLTLAVCQLTYCVVYSISFDQGLLIGAALGIRPGGAEHHAR